MNDESPLHGTAHNIDDIARALVRPSVTMLFAAAFIAFTWLGYVSGEVFSSVAGMIFAFWFSSRTSEKQAASEAVITKTTQPGAGQRDATTVTLRE